MSLPEIYRTTCQLKYVHGMSNKEIVTQLNISDKAVSARLRRAKNTLMKLLADKG